MASVTHSSERTREAQDFRLIVDAIPTLAWSAQGNESVDFFDQRRLEYRGLSAEGVSGWGSTIAVHPDNRKGFDAGREAHYHEESPLSQAARIRTPTLMLSNTGDSRVAISQSYKLFRAIEGNGVETRFVAYPTSGHLPVGPFVNEMSIAAGSTGSKIISRPNRMSSMHANSNGSLDHLNGNRNRSLVNGELWPIERDRGRHGGGEFCTISPYCAIA
jgi:Prolyl oligopeptidase family